MLVLVILEGFVVAILALLVAGLLRSHAEILRQLHELRGGGDPPASEGSHEAPVELRPPPVGAISAHDLVGETPDGEAVAIGVAGAGHHTLLAFLSSGCTTCHEFWQAFARPGRLGLAAGTRLVAVTQGPESESITAVRGVAPPGLTVIMSTQGWHDYRVPGSPYFVLVDGPTGAVVGEGTGTSWSQVRSLMRQAVGDRSVSRQRRRDRGRMDTDDAELLAAGIVPGHVSLFGDPRDTLPAGGVAAGPPLAPEGAAGAVPNRPIPPGSSAGSARRDG